MEKIGEAMGKFFSGVFLILMVMSFAMIMRPLFGIAAGWFVGLFFGPTILSFLAQLGLHGFAMWQIGLCLGFLSAFFPVVLEKPKSKSEK